MHIYIYIYIFYKIELLISNFDPFKNGTGCKGIFNLKNSREDQS